VSPQGISLKGFGGQGLPGEKPPFLVKAQLWGSWGPSLVGTVPFKKGGAFFSHGGGKIRPGNICGGFPPGIKGFFGDPLENTTLRGVQKIGAPRKGVRENTTPRDDYGGPHPRGTQCST